VQTRARFSLDETATRFRVSMSAPGIRVAVDARLGGAWTSSLFPTVDAASAFYRDGAVGWSPRRDGEGAEPLQLTSTEWAVEPAELLSIQSSFFDALPQGSAVLDSAVAMRDLPFVWDTPHIVPDATPQALEAEARRP
jgi:hypothetical protein